MRTEAVVIGGGQAGLATSYHLMQRGIDHVVLERDRLFSAWHRGRWDAFTLVTPTGMTLALPGTSYTGGEPNGFAKLHEVRHYFADYAATLQAPVRCGVAATAVRRGAGDRFVVETSDGAYEARAVVLASGFLAQPKIPALAADLPPHLMQLTARDYRNPAQLPPGAALVVGSANSGAQIAAELHAHGREVYLSLGSAGRVPRRYRGRDVFWWTFFGGIPTGSHHTSGKNGGQTLNLHRFARDGIRLLGRLEGADDTRLTVAPNLHERLAAADAHELRYKAEVDAYIERMGLDAPPPDAPHPDAALRDGFALPQETTLDIARAGITSVIWATGYVADWSWVHLPVCDDAGRLVQESGVTPVPGLYAVGMNHPRTTFVGLVGDEAEHVVNHYTQSR